MSVTEKVRAMLEQHDVQYKANDSIAHLISDADLAGIQVNVEKAVQDLLDALLIDTENDPHSKDTAKRVAKMYLHEVMQGRYHKQPKLTTFPNTRQVDEIIHAGPITLRSMCSHHLVPVMGYCHIGVIPGDKLFGLSKFNRACEWILARPQNQEEAIIQLADFIDKELAPKGQIIVMKADHQCIQWRGVKDVSKMTNSHIRGVFAKNPYAKQEFFELLRI